MALISFFFSCRLTNIIGKAKIKKIYSHAGVRLQEKKKKKNSYCSSRTWVYSIRTEILFGNNESGRKYSRIEHRTNLLHILMFETIVLFWKSCIYRWGHVVSSWFNNIPRDNWRSFDDQITSRSVEYRIGMMIIRHVCIIQLNFFLLVDEHISLSLASCQYWKKQTRMNPSARWILFFSKQIDMYTSRIWPIGHW